MNESKWLGIAALILGFAVCAGAFGAHGLKDSISPYEMEVFNKAVFYQFMHGFAIAIVVFASRLSLISTQAASRICMVFLIGVLLFSGSLYLLVLLNKKWLGAVTPFGGTAFILGWGYFVSRCLKPKI